MITTATSIVKATDVLPCEESVTCELDALAASGDAQALSEVARRAAAYQEYEVRAQATERATYFGRIKVAAEARIGSIDLDLHSVGWTKTELEFDGWTVPTLARARWRTLGMGLRTGQLDRALGLAEERDDSVSTMSVAEELTRLGVLWVDTQPLAQRFALLAESEGLTVAELGRRAGIGRGSYLYHYFPTTNGKPPERTKMARPRAIQLARIMGLDEGTLRSVPRSRRVYPARPARRLRDARPLPGGRLDKAYVLVRKALQELDRAVDGDEGWGTADAWTHLYEAEDIIGRALRRAANGTARG